MSERRDHPYQTEFLIVESDTPSMGIQDLEDPLFREIGMFWSLPVGKRMRVRLRVSGGLSMLEGKLEIAKAPDYPFRRNQALSLRINSIPFFQHPNRGLGALGRLRTPEAFNPMLLDL